MSECDVARWGKIFQYVYQESKVGARQSKFKWLLFSGRQNLKFTQLGGKSRFNTMSTISLGRQPQSLLVNRMKNTEK